MPRSASPSATCGWGHSSASRAIGHVGRAQFARYPDIVARLRAVAPQRLAGGHGAEHGDADRQVMRAACGVAADQRAAMGIGQGVKPVREGGQPGLVQARQGQPQHAANRPGAHGGQVRQVHGQGLVAQGARIHVGKEMPAFQQQVRAAGPPERSG
ncbi:hypothetical protein G6F68_016001 [Rhizopus microsporus]|nr:hypothetical protein G6F68_016001 [Rhizopus microsporus]